jgi:hypothetical protein
VVIGEGEDIMFWHTGGAIGGYAEPRLAGGFEKERRLEL